MQRRPITEKPKKRWGCLFFLILLILAGIAVSAYLYGKGYLEQIIHP